MFNENDIIKKINNTRPILSADDRIHMWGNIETKLITIQHKPTPFIFNIKSHKTMPSLILLLIALLGGGATVFASDAAKPGDLLFPVERSIEDLQIKLARSDESRTALTKKFANERLQELKEIVNEETTVLPSNVQSDVLSTSTVTSLNADSLKIDATTYTDTTIVKVQLEEQKFYFESPAQSRTDLILAVEAKFPTLTDAQVDKVLTLSSKDRASIPQDKGIVTLTDAGNARVTGAINELLKFLDKTGSSDIKRQEIVGLLSGEISNDGNLSQVQHEGGNTQIGDENSQFEIKIDKNGNSKVEVRNGNARVKVEDTNGDTKVRTADTSVSNEDTNKLATTSAINPLQLAVDAKIFTDTTVVKIDFGGQTVYFEAVADTRDGIISAVQQHFPALTKDQIDAVITLEVVKRASKPEDSGLTPTQVAPDPTVTPVVTPVTPKHEDENKNEDGSKENERKNSENQSTDEDRENSEND